jgi:chromosome segregation ATPase
MKTKNIDKYRTDVTLHLVRISGDLEHIKSEAAEIKNHLAKINGRVREAEKAISGIKAVGGTVTLLVGIILTWLGLDK